MNVITFSRCVYVFTIVLALIFVSCQEHHETPANSEIRFSIRSIEQSKDSGGRIKEMPSPSSVLVTILDADGEVVADQRKLDLYKFGEEYLSVPITLTSSQNQYYLSEFFVLGPDQSIQYTTPREGSKFAHLVSDPLDMEFSVTKDNITTVVPEVIEVSENSLPANFGYGQFGFNVIKKIQVILSSFTRGANNFELTESHLKIEGLSGSAASSTTLWFYEADMMAKANDIVIKDALSYRITVSKTGYKNWVDVKRLNNNDVLEIFLEEQNQLPLLKEILFDEYHGTSYSRLIFQYTGNGTIPNMTLGYNCDNEAFSSCAQNGGYFLNTNNQETGKILTQKFFRDQNTSDPDQIVKWEYYPDGKIKIVRRELSPQIGGGYFREEFFYHSNGQLNYSLWTRMASASHPNPTNFNGSIRKYVYGSDGNINKIDTYKYSVNDGVEKIGYQYESEQHTYDNHPTNPQVYSDWYADGPFGKKNNVVWSKFVEYSIYEQDGETYSQISREIEATRVYQYYDHGLPYKETISVSAINQPYVMVADGTVITYSY